MNYDVDKYITKLTVMELKTIIKECLREVEEEKKFSDVEYKALWLKSPSSPPPIETETMPPQCNKPPTNSPFYRHDHVINYDAPYKGKKKE